MALAAAATLDAGDDRRACFDQPPIESQPLPELDLQTWDMIIVGAGVAGSALAHAQGKAGRKVLLLERDLTQPDRIVGEVLQPGGYIQLKKLGLTEAVEGIDSQKVVGYALFMGEDSYPLNYPLEGFEPDVAGRSFHHGRFIQRLRQAAASQESVTVHQAVVTNFVDEDGNDWVEGSTVGGVSFKDGNNGRHIAKAHLTVVCDGMYSTLRKRLFKKKIEINHPSFFVGLKLKNCELPHAKHAHVVLAKPSPILFYPISSTDVRCLVDIRGGKLPSTTDGELEKYLKTVVAPQLPLSLRVPFLEAVDRGGIKSIRNKQMPAQPVQQPGALMLGDAFNMRHPLTGGGMTVALSDCKVLSDMLRPMPDFSNFDEIAHQTSGMFLARKPVSATVNTLANALYEVFCYTGDDIHEEMREACFNYLKLGGIYSEGPMSLLSALNPEPMVLVVHFFMVAFYGVVRNGLPSSPYKMWRGLRLVTHAAGIILPILRDEGFNMFLTFMLGKQRAGI